MFRLLLLAATAYGAAIPPSPSCLEKCLVTGGVVGAAADLNFFKSVAVDINNFCTVYTTLLKCAAECSQDDLNLLMNHTVHASYVCKDKMDEIKTVHDCLENDTTDPLSDCAKVCHVTEHVPLRLDSTATAPVNPNVPAEGTAPLCEKQMCVMKCSREALNKQCAGAGNLFRDVARHQVQVGWDMLQVQSENGNDTAAQLVALSYLANIPEKCVFLTNTEVFDKEMSADTDKVKGMLPVPGTDFSNDTAIETSVAGAGSTDLFDPVLFEFSPALEPDVPMGPPSTGGGDSAEIIDAPVQEEEEVKVIGGGGVPIEAGIAAAGAAGAAAASADAPTSTESKEEGEHEQPKPAEAAADADDTDDEAESAESADKEVALTPRPGGDSAITGEGTGLIPSRPVSEEDKDKDTEAEEGETATEATAEDKTVESVEKTDETPTTGEEGDMNKDESKEGVEGEKPAESTDTEGSEITTESVIVVDDDKQIENNEVVPVTEATKVNSSMGRSLVASFLAFALALLVCF